MSDYIIFPSAIIFRRFVKRFLTSHTRRLRHNMLLMNETWHYQSSHRLLQRHWQLVRLPNQVKNCAHTQLIGPAMIQKLKVCGTKKLVRQSFAQINTCWHVTSLNSILKINFSWLSQELFMRQLTNQHNAMTGQEETVVTVFSRVNSSLE